MTISRTLRARLRRYALFCFLTAATAATASDQRLAFAGQTHDSSELTCREIDASEKTSRPKPLVEQVSDEGCNQHRADKVASSAEEASCSEKHASCSEDDASCSGEQVVSSEEWCGWIEDHVAVVCRQQTMAGKTLSGPDPSTSEEPANEKGLAHEAVASQAAPPCRDAAPQRLAAADSSRSDNSESTTAESMSVDQELADTCNLVDTCNYDDRVAIVPDPGTPEVDPDETPKLASRTSSRFNATIATIAAAATAGNPIRFSEWTEPFAMIGPAGGHTPAEVEAFQAWFDESKRVLADFVPVVDFNGVIAGEATTPAIDVAETSEADGVEDPLVGGSPFIATLAIMPEEYRPYDLAQRDHIPSADGLELRAESDGDAEAESQPPAAAESSPAATGLVWADGLFSPAHQPFCIRSLAVMRPAGWSPLAPREVAEAPSKPERVADPRIVGPADCLLDELVWQINVALEEERVTDRWLRPVGIGKRVASLVVSGDQLASRMASELALVWPAAAVPANPIPGAGAKLLARAEAAERLPEEGLANSFSPEQLARADAMFWQWVDVAQRVIDDVADRLTDVTEVARNRGTQDDSTRR